MSIVESKSSFHKNGDTLSPIFSNDVVSIDPSHDGVVMLSSDLHLFGDADIRPDGRKIFHIFERAPEDDQRSSDYPCKAPQKDKEELWLKACQTTFKNIEEIMMQNGITLDEWCPLLSESVQNSRNNTSNAVRRKNKTSALKNFKNQGQADMKSGGNYQKTAKKVGSSKLTRNKEGKENGNTFSAGDEARDKSKKQKFYCFNCGFATLYKYNLKKHIFEHCPKRVKVVPGRQANFKNKLLLPAKDRYYLCDMCNFSTHNKKNLKTHKMTHLNEKKFVCPFCGFASSTLNRTQNHIHKMHQECKKKELAPKKLNNNKNYNRQIRRISEDGEKCDNLKFSNVKIESKTIISETKDNLTDKSSPIRIANSPNSRNVDMNSTIVVNKCIDLHAKEVKVCGENIAKIISKLDNNVTSVKEEVVQTLNENVTVKEERHTDIEYDIVDNITTRKEKIPVKFECDDDSITSAKEVETDVKFDDNSSYTKGCKEIQNRYSNSNVFEHKQKLHSSFRFIRMESRVKELSQNIKQEAKLPSSYSNDSDSFIGNDNLEVKRETSNISDEIESRLLIPKREIKNRFCSDKKKPLFEVIKNTNAGTSTFIFKSLECPYSCLDKYKIIQHCRTHEKNKTYRCSDCDFSAKCLFLLKQHKKSHTEILEYCSSCPFVTKSVSTLRKHTYVQHSKSRNSYVASKLRKKSVKFKNLECNMCSFITIDRNKYREHIKIHFRNKTKMKKRRSSRSSTLARAAKISEVLNEPNNDDNQICKVKTRRRIIVKKKLNCDKCKFFTYSMKKLANHNKRHVKLENLKINDSSIEVPSKDKLKEEKLDDSSQFFMKKLANHNKRHVKSESLKINDSSIEVPSKDKLKEEKLDDSSQSSFYCSNCSFTTFLKIDFLKHKQVHMSSAAGLFKCTECEFSANKYKVLVSHLMTHAYEHLYKCIHCNFSSNNKATLKSHKENHKNPRIKTNIRQYRGSKCTVKPRNSQVFKCFRCDYTCISEHLLNQHSLSHFENKLLKCADCDYETNFKGNLVRHVLIHVDEYIIN